MNLSGDIYTQKTKGNQEGSEGGSQYFGDRIWAAKIKYFSLYQNGGKLRYCSAIGKKSGGFEVNYTCQLLHSGGSVLVMTGIRILENHLNQLYQVKSIAASEPGRFRLLAKSLTGILPNTFRGYNRYT